MKTVNTLTLDWQGLPPMYVGHAESLLNWSTFQTAYSGFPMKKKIASFSTWKKHAVCNCRAWKSSFENNTRQSKQTKKNSHKHWQLFPTSTHYTQDSGCKDKMCGRLDWVRIVHCPPWFSPSSGSPSSSSSSSWKKFKLKIKFKVKIKLFYFTLMHDSLVFVWI